MDLKIDLKLLLAFVAAVSPVLGYGLAYVYQLGFCNYFNIPIELIKLDWTTILVAIAAAFGSLFFIANFLVLLLTIPHDTSPLKQKIYMSLILFFSLLIFGFMFLTTNEFTQLVIVFGISLLVIFFGPWLSKKLFANQINTPKTPIDERLNRFIHNKYFKYTGAFFYLLILIFLCCSLAGRANAMKEQIFYVPSSNPDSIVLKIYGDNIICGQLVQKQNQTGLGPTIFVLSLSNTPNLSLTPIKLNLAFTMYPK